MKAFTAGLKNLIGLAAYDQKTLVFNDGRCDAKGPVFFAGTMYSPKDAFYGRVTSNSAMEKKTLNRTKPAWTSNGLAFSPGQQHHVLFRYPNHVVIYQFNYD